MELTHLHVGFKDFAAASSWFTDTLGNAPLFFNDKLAYHRCGGVIVVLERAAIDVPVTLAFKSVDVDRDVAALQEKGAVALQGPVDQKWGVRSAYLRGPGGLVVELEQ